MKIRLLLSLGSFLLVSACAIVKEKETPFSGIWRAPGIRSREFLQESLPFYSPTGVTVAYWTDATGRKRRAEKYIDDVTKYLVRNGYFERWPKGGMGFDDVESQIRAPYSFSIVSIDPVVVVLTSRFESDPTYTPPSPQRRSLFASTKYMENLFEYGISFVDRPEILWFLPSTDDPPRSVEFSADRKSLRIQAMGVEIRATLENEVWTTQRLR